MEATTVSAGNLQKLRKPAEAYGNPMEDQEAKPCRNHAEVCGNPAKSCRNPVEAYGNPTEDLVAHTFFG